MSRNTSVVHSPDNRPISVIIPCAGIGNRMKSYGPKCLIKINDHHIIDRQLNYIHKYLYRPEIIVVTGFESKKIKSHLQSKKNLKIVENENWENGNVISSLNTGLQHATNPNVLIIYGDLVFNAWTLKAPFGISSLLIIDSSGYMKDEEVGVITNKNEVVSLMYGLPNKWAQIAYFTGNELKQLYKYCSLSTNQHKLGFEGINHILNCNGQFVAYSPKRMKAMDIDSSKDLILAEEI